MPKVFDDAACVERVTTRQRVGGFSTAHLHTVRMIRFVGGCFCSIHIIVVIGTV
jgi:hypothetical protein